VLLFIGATVYVLAFCIFGVISLSKGHWVMFLFGFLVPPLWLVGTVLAPRGAAAEPVQGGFASGIDAKTREEMAYVSSFSGLFGD